MSGNTPLLKQTFWLLAFVAATIMLAAAAHAASHDHHKLDIEAECVVCAVALQNTAKLSPGAPPEIEPETSLVGVQWFDDLRAIGGSNFVLNSARGPPLLTIHSE
ncbi:hypothetical protein [Hyphococcus sp.]|uniref:hypothetical protein n=1 Tax=Hyphococcus sp. TaxID=2038636 RepID=UPI003CCBBDD4